LLNTLNSAVLDVALFVGVKLRPFSVLEFKEEIQDEQGVYKVDKSISNVSLILEIDG